MDTLIRLFANVFSIFNRRYVNRFIPVFQELTTGKTDSDLTQQEQQIIETLRIAIKNINGMLDRYPKIREIDELIYIDIVDIDNFKLAVRIKDGDATVKVGWDINQYPSFILPLLSVNIHNLVEVTKDNDLDINAVYRIIRALFIPFLQGLYQSDYDHLPKNKSYLKLDNYIQIEVVPNEPIEVDGFPGPAKATVVNVDHQWLIFEGWQGDPDIRYSMSVEDAVLFAYLIRVKLIQGDSDVNEMRKVVAEYNTLKDKTTVYERDWH